MELIIGIAFMVLGFAAIGIAEVISKYCHLYGDRKFSDEEIRRIIKLREEDNDAKSNNSGHVKERMGNAD